MEQNQYQPVIGLEIHVQLQTQSKVFATEGFSFGAEPNSYVSPITMAHPGALPSINMDCVAQAIKMGLAIECEINQQCFFDRKNYFYPDLPKGYQMSQDQKPICRNGRLVVGLKEEDKKEIRIERIHIEEDAGKSIHDLDERDTLVDLNRAGVGLIEIVTHPDLRSAEDAGLFFAEIRKLARYLEVCDGNMEEGSMRCDANVSVMKHDATEYGTRVEIKNINSISNLKKAIRYEIKRQINTLEQGGKINQETRTWDPTKAKTFPMRDKETADDYRYFPEPDLLPLMISDAQLEVARVALPTLPQQRFAQYHHELGISLNESLALVEEKALSDYFEAMRQAGAGAKAASNWLLGPVKTHLNEQGIAIEDFPIAPVYMAVLARLVEDKKLSHGIAKQKVFPEMLRRPEENPEQIAEPFIADASSGSDQLEAQLSEIFAKHPKEVQRYKQGKKALAGFFVGKLMKAVGGNADAKQVNQLVRQKLDTLA